MGGLRWKWEAAPAGVGEQRSSGGKVAAGGRDPVRSIGRQWERVGTNVPVAQMTEKTCP